MIAEHCSPTPRFVFRRKKEFIGMKPVAAEAQERYATIDEIGHSVIARGRRAVR